MDSLKKTLMKRDNLTDSDADVQISEAKEELMKRLDEGEMPFDLCEELFGLEPDYLEDLLF